ncbi:MAG: FecR domain-containing protein [bacterium]|nr:FecR domain-containing protein [bacterium]
MTIRETIIEVLKKYKFHYPVSDKVQGMILKSKKKVLSSIIRQTKKNSVVVPIAVRLYYAIKHYRPTTTLATSVRLVHAASFIMIACITTSIIFTAKIYVLDKEQIQIAKPELPTGTIIFAIGDIKVKTGEKERTLVQAKDIININDTITTGKDSTVTIQVTDLGVVRVLADSTVSFSSLLSKTGGTGGAEGESLTETTLSRGSLFSKILKKNTKSYRVKTPTCVASVRGTEFLTTFKNGSSKIELHKGSVGISVEEKDVPEKLVKENEAAQIGPEHKVRVSSIRPIRRLQLKKSSLHPYIENFKEKSDLEIAAIFEKVKEDEKLIDLEIKKLADEWNNLSGLDKLRKQGKPITMLHLRDQTQIAGHVRGQDGTNLTLDTGDGVIKIPVIEIVRRFPIK